MPEIIPPESKKSKKGNKSKRTNKGIVSSDWFSYVYLIVGIIALVRGFLLLLDIAVGLILVLLGFTAVNKWLMKK